MNFKDEFVGEGIRKLHSEILQLDNQRFLLTTTAVIFFGTVAGWVTTSLLRTGVAIDQQAAPAAPVRYLLPAITLLVWVALYALFRYQSSLAFTVRWLAAYHMLKGSDWEWNWHVFRRLDRRHRRGEVPYAAYDVITAVFNALIIIAFMYFFFLHLILFGLPSLSTEEALHTMREAPSQLLTPWLGWVLLALILPMMLVLIRRRTRKVTNADEAMFLESWKEAECVALDPRSYPAPPSETA